MLAISVPDEADGCSERTDDAVVRKRDGVFVHRHDKILKAEETKRTFVREYIVQYISDNIFK